MMRQKILLFISILVLNCFSLYAEEESLPQLPELPSVNALESQNTVNGQLSFFDKVKNFFGFGGGPKDEDQPSTESAAMQDKAERVEAEDKLLNPIDEGYGNTDEGPMSASLPSFNNEGEKEVSLPSNFDDVSLDQNTNIRDGETLSYPDLVTSKEPVKEGANDLDDKLELPTGFDDVNEPLTESMEVDPETTTPLVDQLQLPSGFDEAEAFPTESIAASADNTGKQAEERLTLPSEFDDAGKEPPTESTEANADKQAEEKLTLPSGFDKKNQAENNDVTEDTTLDLDETTNSSRNLLESPRQEDSASLEAPSLPPVAVENDELAVPSYVPDIDTKITPEDDVSKYTKELQEKQQTLKPVEKISETELATGNNVIEQYTEITSASLDKTQLQFVNNEAQVLILPNDDIVLGELTEEAKFNLIDLRSYAGIFWDKYYQLQREPERDVIEDFIKNYDENFSNEEYLYSTNIITSGMKDAFKAIDKDNIYALIAILNSYPVLQLTGDGDNTLLHEASYVGNYSAARLLVLKGIDIFAKNENNQTALNVAEKFNNQHIVFLLKSANLK